MKRVKGRDSPGLHFSITPFAAIKHLFVFCVISCSLYLLFFSSALCAEPAEATMLAAIAPDSPFQARKNGFLDSQFLRANTDAILGVRSQTIDKIILPIMGTSPEFFNVFHKNQGNNIVTWKGQSVEGDCTLILTLGQDHFFGNAFCNDGRSVQFEPFDTEQGVVSYISDPMDEIPLHNDTDMPPPVQSGTVQKGADLSSVVTAAGSQDDGTRIDVMVLYTDGLANDYPGDQINTRIQYLIDLANDAYINSQINTQLQLVYSQQINYPDTLDASGSDYFTLLRTAASELRNNTGVFAGIEGLRTKYGADHVTLLRKLVNEGCGFTWFTSGSAGGASSAYSIVHDGAKVSGANCNVRSYAHEIGHTFGCDHDVANASGGRAFDYSYGYVDSTDPLTFRTVMAYTFYTMIPYFSNPDLNYQGEPIGAVNQADNAATINATRINVAQYRAAVSSLTVTAPDGGESWRAGSSQTITWNSFNFSGNVNIELYKAGNPILKIANNIPGNSYNWSIPATLVSGTDYSVKVTASTNPSLFDMSDSYFTIQEPVGIISAIYLLLFGTQ